MCGKYWRSWRQERTFTPRVALQIHRKDRWVEILNDGMEGDSNEKEHLEEKHFLLHHSRGPDIDIKIRGNQFEFRNAQSSDLRKKKDVCMWFYNISIA